MSQVLSYAGKGEFVNSPVDLTGCVRSIWDLLKDSAPDSVRVNTKLQSDLPPVCADPSRIKQIIIDFVRNAAGGIPRDRAGTVSIRTSLEEIIAEGDVVDAFSHTPVRLGERVCLEVRTTASAAAGLLLAVVHWNGKMKRTAARPLVHPDASVMSFRETVADCQSHAHTGQIGSKPLADREQWRYQSMVSVRGPRRRWSSMGG